MEQIVFSCDDDRRPFRRQFESIPPSPESAGAAADDVHGDALSRLNESGVPYLVGGAYAFSSLTRITHSTKDLDVFVRRTDCRRLLDVLARGGWQTEMPFSHWLAKARRGPYSIDVIFSSGNGETPIDDMWLDNSLPADVCGVPVNLCPIEEAVWMKAFIMERERYDGADVAHLLRVTGAQLDWQRLLWRFGSRWPVLLSHLVLYGFIYPGERTCVPAWVVRELSARLTAEWEQLSSPAGVCRGGLLSRAQYAADFEDWHYLDARIYPLGKMTVDEVAAWTDAAPEKPRAK